MFKVYFPVEIIQREFDYKSKLADLLNGNGFQASLKPLDDLFDDLLNSALPPGIIIVKSIQRYLFFKLLILRLLGNRIVYLEEEAWVPFSTDDIIRRRFPKRNRLLIDHILCPNKFLFDAYRLERFVKSDRITLVGSERMRNKDVFRIRKVSKVLIIGSVVSESWDDYWSIYKSELGFFANLRKREYKCFYEMVMLDHSRLIEIGNQLSERGFSVFYRPHPAELMHGIHGVNMEILDNSVKVGLQALDFDLVLHSGSTSAFELSGVNIVAVSHESSLNVHANSKFYGPMVHNLTQLETLIASKFSCLFYNDLMVTGFDGEKFLNIMKKCGRKHRINLPFASILFKIYRSTLMKVRRNNKLVIDRRNAWIANNR
jgi:hypothetical protein